MWSPRQDRLDYLLHPSPHADAANCVHWQPLAKWLLAVLFLFAAWHGVGEVRVAFAADPTTQIGPWQVSEVHGAVLVRPTADSTAIWRPLEAEQPVESESEIMTGPDGLAVLSNGPDVIRLPPNGRVVVPAYESGGLLTLVRQKIGTLFVDVGARPGRQFEVDAPYLVVLVKGTQFTVHANTFDNQVEVTRGTVEVKSKKGGDSSLVSEGETATVSAGGDSSVQVDQSPGTPTPGPSADDPAALGGGGRRNDEPHGPPPNTNQSGDDDDDDDDDDNDDDDDDDDEGDDDDDEGENEERQSSSQDRGFGAGKHSHGGKRHGHASNQR